MKIYRAKQWLTYNLLMSYWQFEKHRQSLISAPLILHRTADSDILIAIAPVFGQALPNPLGAFCHDVEMQVAPSLYHQPCLFAPFVGILDKEIRCEASPHQRAGRHFPVSATVSADGEVERSSLRHDIGVLLKLRITPEHITMLTALALLVASVPQVPHLAHRLLYFAFTIS